MVELQTILRDYGKIVLKVVFEGIAFLTPALILAFTFRVLFYPASDGFPLAPSGIAVVTFSVAFSKNYCFLEEDKYGLVKSEESDREERTLSDFADG